MSDAIPLKNRMETLYRSLLSHVANMVAIRQYVLRAASLRIRYATSAATEEPELLVKLRSNDVLRDKVGHLFSDEVRNAASTSLTSGVARVGEIIGESHADVAVQVMNREWLFLGDAYFPNVGDAYVDLLCKHLQRSPFRTGHQVVKQPDTLAEYKDLKKSLTSEQSLVASMLAAKIESLSTAPRHLPASPGEEYAGPLMFEECMKVFGKSETATRRLLAKRGIEKRDGQYLLPRSKLSDQEFEAARVLFAKRQESVKPRRKRAKPRNSSPTGTPLSEQARS